MLNLDFEHGTVEPEGLELLSQLIEASCFYPGPIIEIGTLFGKTTIHMALTKADKQQIITVDNYSWNPWGLSSDSHFKLTSMMLHYLIEKGHVQQVRMDKDIFFKTYKESPALVFIDSVHTYLDTKRAIDWAKFMNTKIICGHDYCNEFIGVKQIVDEFGGPRQLKGTIWTI